MSEKKVTEQKDMNNISSLNEYATLLVNAIGSIYPIIIYCNLTQDYYKIVSSADYLLKPIQDEASFDDLTKNTLTLIPKEEYKKIYLKYFSKENLIQAYNEGKHSIQAKVHIDNEIYKDCWIEIKVVFVPNQDGDITEISFIRNITNDVKKELQLKYSKAVSGLLSNEYVCIYYANLDEDECIPITTTLAIQERIGDLLNQKVSYTNLYKQYANRCVQEADKKEFLKSLEPTTMKVQFKNNDRFTLVYRNELDEYCEMKCVKLGDWKQNHTVIIGFASKDKEIRKELKDQTELKIAKEKAEAANEAKSLFLSRVSHDIRTPINSIIGMTDLAQKSTADSERIEYCLEKISKASSHLLALVNDILDLNCIESNKLEIAHKPMNLFAFLDGCISVTSGFVVNRNITIEPVYGEDIKHPFIFGDELHLRQVIVNILSNAVKYTNNGGHIFLRAKEISAGETTVIFRIEIEDNGIGMSKEFQDHIWESFSQEANSAAVNTEYKGTGLGMAISKELIELMGGSVSVSSELNKGSVFTVEVPFAIDYQATILNHENNENSIKSLLGTRILLVEDNDVNREISENLLTEEGAIVTIAKDGLEAVKIFSESELNAIDAVLMDIVMPNMDGLEATRTIRNMNRPDALTTPIIAITANAFDQDINRSMEAGMNAHLIKPLRIHQLTRTLLQCIRMRSIDQAEKLKIAMNQANKDSLTKVNNRTAYDNIESKITSQIAKGDDLKFAILVCDVNNLKTTNDTIGHEAGDLLIVEGCHIICNTFKHSPVYRVGGDEFAVLLQKTDYENRMTLLKHFQEKMAKEIFIKGAVSIASGLADYEPEKDLSVADVFKRADEEMYKNKKNMKKQLQSL